MIIERVWCYPSKWTFSMKPVRNLIREEMAEDELWGDPFAGRCSPAQVTNDLNPECSATSHMDALEFLQSQPSAHFDGLLLDPPYSNRQAADAYASFGKGQLTATVTNNRYWAQVKDEAARIIRPGGKALWFGWNSNGLGLSRGFVLRRVLLIAHGGGGKNDTICTVEVKVEISAHPSLFQEAPTC